ncbi:MAG: hypothetical protein M0C28_07875 [Candidatus Moduliflexus flocculans]|nr:hypothetical protein [Candidatus Moduliflexus flocculans]
MDLVDMHEAFAAQVLSNLQAFASRELRPREASAATRPLGEIDPDRLNVNGGSIALGHPFGATGGPHDRRRSLKRAEAARTQQFGLADALRAGRPGRRRWSSSGSDRERHDQRSPRRRPPHSACRSPPTASPSVDPRRHRARPVNTPVAGPRRRVRASWLAELEARRRGARPSSSPAASRSASSPAPTSTCWRA